MPLRPQPRSWHKFAIPFGNHAFAVRLISGSQAIWSAHGELLAQKQKLLLVAAAAAVEVESADAAAGAAEAASSAAAAASAAARWAFWSAARHQHLHQREHLHEQELKLLQRYALQQTKAVAAVGLHAQAAQGSSEPDQEAPFAAAFAGTAQSTPFAAESVAAAAAAAPLDRSRPAEAALQGLQQPLNAGRGIQDLWMRMLELWLAAVPSSTAPAYLHQRLPSTFPSPTQELPPSPCQHQLTVRWMEMEELQVQATAATVIWMQVQHIWMQDEQANEVHYDQEPAQAAAQ